MLIVVHVQLGAQPLLHALTTVLERGRPKLLQWLSNLYVQLATWVTDMT